jgi:hypothetical protein
MQIPLMPISLPAAMRPGLRLRLSANNDEAVAALPRRSAKTVPVSGLPGDLQANEYQSGGYAGI